MEEFVLKCLKVVPQSIAVVTVWHGLALLRHRNLSHLLKFEIDSCSLNAFEDENNELIDL